MSPTPTIAASGTINLNTGGVTLGFGVAGLPSSLLPGDILVLLHGTGYAGTWSQPSNGGWGVANAGNNHLSLYRTITGLWDTSNNGYFYNHSVGTRSSVAFFAVRGASHVQYAPSSVTVSTTTFTPPAITPATSGQSYLYVTYWAGAANGTLVTNTPPSGYSTLQSIAPGSADSGGAVIWTKAGTDATETPGAGTFAPTSISGFARTIAFWNEKELSGVTKDDTDAVAARVVMLYDRDTGLLLGKTTSAGDGTYSLAGKSASSNYFAVCQDDSAGTVYNDLILRVTPG